MEKLRSAGLSEPAPSAALEALNEVIGALKATLPRKLRTEFLHELERRAERLTKEGEVTRLRGVERSHCKAEAGAWLVTRAR